MDFYGIGWTTNTFVKQPKNEEENLLGLTARFSWSIYGYFNSSAICGDLRWIGPHRYSQRESLSYAQVKKERKRQK